MDELKQSIINAFFYFHQSLENGRPIINYYDIKEAIYLENYIVKNEIDVINIDHFIKKAILNLKTR